MNSQGTPNLALIISNSSIFSNHDSFKTIENKCINTKYKNKYNSKGNVFKIEKNNNN